MLQALPTKFILQNALRENSKFGFLYLNNPKVGCSTIKTSLWTGVNGAAPQRGQPVHQLDGGPFANELPAPDIADRAFVFSFVRNPYQRLVSAYLDKVEHRKDRVWQFFAKNHGLDSQATVGFDQFVEIITGNSAHDNDPHWRPQYLNALYPFVTPNLLADLESLDALLPQILTRIFGAAAPAVAQRRTHSTAARQTWRSFYGDGGTLRRVRQFYDGDFAAFGYPDAVDAESKSTLLPRLSEHHHPGLADLSRYFRAKPAEQQAALGALSAYPALQDWVLGQKMRRPRLYHTTRPQLVHDHRAQIDASDYLRKLSVKGAQD